MPNVGSKLDEIIASQTEFLNEQTIIRSDIKDIKQVLAGDDYGNDGLVKNHRDLKTVFYALRDDVKKIKVIGGVLGAIFTGLIALISIFK